MVDPKKEYELLMRYLHDGAAKHRAPAPKQPFAKQWQPKPQPAITSTPAHTSQTVVEPSIKRLPKPLFTWRRKRITVRRIARLAIAVLSGVLLLALVWNAYYFYRLSAEGIFQALYEPFTTTTSSTNTPQAATTDIETYFAAGNYVAATLKSRKQTQLSDREKLLTGLAFLHREDYIKSIKWLEPLANNFKSTYRRQAEYYLALVYLRNEDYDRAVETMERIAHTAAHPYQHVFTDVIISDIKLLKWK